MSERHVTAVTVHYSDGTDESKLIDPGVYELFTGLALKVSVERVNRCEVVITITAKPGHEPKDN